jgi:uncharacterized protein with HEPN domain
MTERSKKYLSDISRAVNLIEEFTTDIIDFDAYIIDLKTQSAVERQLAIIGEALNMVRQNETDIEIGSAHKIIGFRNRLIRAYDSIDNSIVSMILKRHLPRLKQEISALSAKD